MYPRAEALSKAPQLFFCDRRSRRRDATLSRLTLNPTIWCREQPRGGRVQALRRGGARLYSERLNGLRICLWRIGVFVGGEVPQQTLPVPAQIAAVTL